MRHDFGFARQSAARLQRRAAARTRLRRRRRERLSMRLGLAAAATAFALVPGRVLFAWAFGS